MLMDLKYDIEIADSAIISNINRITNQIFKLLPNREEGIDWQLPLETIIIEIGGMNRLFNDQILMFSLLCKLEGLYLLNNEEDFPAFRKTIFECLGKIDYLKRKVGCKNGLSRNNEKTL